MSDADRITCQQRAGDLLHEARSMEPELAALHIAEAQVWALLAIADRADAISYLANGGHQVPLGAVRPEDL